MFSTKLWILLGIFREIRGNFDYIWSSVAPVILTINITMNIDDVVQGDLQELWRDGGKAWRDSRWDEGAGRAAKVETPVYYWPLTSSTDLLIQVCFSISQRALFTPLMHCTVLTPIFKTIPPSFYLMTVFYGHNWHLIIHHFQPHPTPHLLTWWLGRYLQTCMKETVPALMKRIAIATQRVGLTITVALET